MRTLGLRFVLSVTLVALAAIWLLWQQRSLEDVRTALGLLRQQGDSLSREAERLSEENAALASPAGDAAELARLRAENAELLRARAERIRRANTAPANLADAAQPGAKPDLRRESAAAPSADLARNNAIPPRAPPGVKPESAPKLAPAPAGDLMAKGTGQLRSGDTLVAGGWLMEDGTRAYALLTPVLGIDEIRRIKVLIQAQLVAVPDDALTASARDHLIGHGRETQSYWVADGTMLQNFLRRRDTPPDAKALVSPSLDCGSYLWSTWGGARCAITPGLRAPAAFASRSMCSPALRPMARACSSTMN